MEKKNINRREFLGLASAAAVTTAAAMTGCSDSKTVQNIAKTSVSNSEIPTDKMTYRVNPKTGDKISVLGYGFMRLPTITNISARESDDEIDQETVNKLTDYALEHGLNLFDTSPAYCKGRSEHSMGIALSRHPRNSYFISTKLSNFATESWTREKSIAMYKNSLKELQTEYIDYLHLHGIGMGAADMLGNPLDGMQAFNQRYIDNGLLDFLLAEREAGRIKNLGFSYHGDVKVFDYLLSQHDKYKWDFAMIQMNYVDWKYANELNPRNTDAEYLYAELEKRNIPVFVMEPILGGRLANLPTHLAEQLLSKRPDNSIASWSFRWIASHPNILTILSGMTYMEHLQDNIKSLSPLDPCDESEYELLQRTADEFVNFPLVPCTQCQYCMPCPYGIDIPGSFTHYNKCVNEGFISVSKMDANFVEARKRFLIGYDRKVERNRQADHCIGCGKCVSHCPQNIQIPEKLTYINNYIEKLRTETL